MDIAQLIEIALSAGAEINRIYSAGALSKSTKADGSFVTLADTMAERVILAGLHAHDGDTPIIAEEEAAAGRLPETSDRFYLVDPLDGTREFVDHNDDFTVNIALISHGVPVAGVVYAPALGQLFAAIDGRAMAARVVDGVVGRFEEIRARKAPTSVVVLGSRSHGSSEETQWFERYNVDRHVRRGSSLKFCLIASGEADLYPRFGCTMEWDTAAGDAVLRAAGGIVTTVDGAPLTYNKRRHDGSRDFRNPPFIAYGDLALAAQCVGANVQPEQAPRELRTLVGTPYDDTLGVR